jgi:uncharacterized damage-inducible protein DinB
VKRGQLSAAGGIVSDIDPLAAHLARYTGGLLRRTAGAVEDLSVDELHYRPHANTNSIGFDAWHVARTIDNLINFAFQRKSTVWVEQGLDSKWGLPKADQGTGMSPEAAHALRFPGAAELAAYCRDVEANVVPQIEAMDAGYLAGTMTIRPQGEMARRDIIGQVIVVHGNNHLGQIDLARTLQGKQGLGI